MRKLLKLTIPAAIAAVIVSAFAVAGPGIGITTDPNSMSGNGSAGSALGLRRDCGPSGKALVWNGTQWGCSSVGSGTVTSIATTAPISGGPITSTGTIGLSLCTGNQILKMNGGGTAWTCAADSDTTYSAGTGLSLASNTFTLAMTAQSCSAGSHISAATATGTFTCTADSGGSVGGSGTSGKVPRWTASSTLGDSSINDNGSAATFTGALTSIANTNLLGWVTWNVISPTGLTGTVHDWAPTGYSSASDIRASTSGTTTIDGFAGATTGRIFWLHNAGPNNIVIGNQTGSTATLQVITGTGANVTMLADQSAAFVYDGTSNRWRMVEAPPNLYTASTGLSLTSNAFSLNITGASCTSNAVMTALNSSGTGTCSAPPTFTSSASGYAPASGGGTTNYLRADGSWAVPPGSGGGLSGLTTSKVPRASSSTTIADGSITDTLSALTFGVASTFSSTVTITSNTLTIGRWGGTTISPTAITGLTNNWSPTGLSGASTIRINTSGAVDLTGIDSSTAGGRLRIVNIGANNVDVYNDNTNSTAANRFLTPDGRTWHLQPGYSMELEYDSTAARYRVVGHNINFQLPYIGVATVFDATEGGNFNSYRDAMFGDASSDKLEITGNVYSVGQSPGLGKPTFTSCGTSPGVVGGSHGFVVTPGSGSPTSCVLTFATAFLDKPACTATRIGNTAGTFAGISAISASGLTLVMCNASSCANAMTGDIHVICTGTSINPASP